MTVDVAKVAVKQLSARNAVSETRAQTEWLLHGILLQKTVSVVQAASVLAVMTTPAVSAPALVDGCDGASCSCDKDKCKCDKDCSCTRIA